MLLKTGLVLALLCLASATAHSAPKVAAEADNPWVAGRIDYKRWGLQVSDFAVSANGQQNWETGFQMLERFRLGVSGGWKWLGIHLEGDAFYGLLDGEFPQPGMSGTQFAPKTPTKRDSFVPRKAYVQATAPFGVFRIGQQTSSWGLGILANSGEDNSSGLFSHKTGGDLVQRALFATKPLKFFSRNSLSDKLIFALGADLVYRDENAYLLDDDVAFQYLGSLLYKTKKVEGGAYVVYRDQEDANGATLNVLVVDLAGKVNLQVSKQVSLKGGAEVAWLSGRTTRNRTFQSPDGPDINALGAAVELFAHLKQPALAAGFKAGLASGDGDNDDGTIFRFRMDPDYNVGLILFDHYLAGMTAGAVDRIHAPEQAAVAPDGIQGIATNGSIENALYIAPAVTYGGAEGFGAGVQALLAWSHVAHASPRETFEAGGSAGYLGNSTTSLQRLGVEFDLSARYRLKIGRLMLEAKGEGGVLLPGPAFTTAGGCFPDTDVVTLLQGVLTVRWEKKEGGNEDE